MKKIQKIWIALISIGLLLLIWIPVFLYWYDYVTALFILFGVVIGGWAGERIIRYKQENQ